LWGRGLACDGEIIVSLSKPYVEVRLADYLRSPGDVASYLNAALEDGDERVLLAALRNAAEAVGDRQKPPAP
jgi:DNA-binding phage protein